MSKSRVKVEFLPRPRPALATAQEDIRAGDLIEIDLCTGNARRARFGDATAAEIGAQDLHRPSLDEIAAADDDRAEALIDARVRAVLRRP